MNRKISRYILITCLLLFGVLAINSTTQSLNPTKVYINPPSIEDPNLSPGKSFSINISIGNVSNLLSYDFNMSYNTAIMTCIGVSVGPLENMPSPMWEINAQTGNVWINVTYGTPLTTDPPATLASINFLVQGRGTGVFDLYSIKLVNSFGEQIFHEVSDGYFSNCSPYDLNQDGHIDIADMRIVARAYDSSPGDPNWDARADVNKDGHVNIFDLRLVAKHYGEM